MRKLTVLGASALVLALVAAPAFASPQRKDLTGYFTQNPYWGESVAQLDGTAPAPVAGVPDLSNFRAQAPDSEWQAPTYTNLPLEHHGR